MKTKPDGQEKMWSGIPERRPVKKREKKELSFIILRFESHFEPAFPVIENHPKGFLGWNAPLDAKLSRHPCPSTCHALLVPDFY